MRPKAAGANGSGVSRLSLSVYLEESEARNGSYRLGRTPEAAAVKGAARPARVVASGSRSMGPRASGPTATGPVYDKLIALIEEGVDPEKAVRRWASEMRAEERVGIAEAHGHLIVGRHLARGRALGGDA